MNYPAWLARLLVHSGVASLLPGLRHQIEGGTEFLHYCSDRLIGSPLAQLAHIAVALDDAPPDVIDLTAGSGRFDIVPSSTTRLPADRRGWPNALGLPELRGAVAASLLTNNRHAVSPAEEVLITAGALGATQIILDAFVNRGDAVVLPEPTSPMFGLLARSRGAKVRWVGTACEDGRLTLRFDHLARRLWGARLLILCSPGNPTGGMIAAEDLEQIVWWCQRHDVLILSDESFARFCYEDEPVSVATLPRARQRTLTVGSVSKSHALAWARVGWIAAQRHLLRACAATAVLRSSFVPTLSQQIALSALQTSEDAFAPILDQFDSRRHHAFDRLRGMGLKPTWPVGAFFLWLPVPPGWRDGRAFADALFSERRVRVAPGDLFGPSGRGYVRISYASDDGRLEEGLNRLGDHVRAGRDAGQKAKAA